MKWPRRIAIGVVLSGWLAASFAQSADFLSAPWQIEADHLDHQENPRTITAEGNVRIDQQDDTAKPVTITADWVRYEAESGLLAARGNVNIVSGTEQVAAEAVQLDLDRMTGIIEKTTLFLPGSSLHFKGDVVEKTGDLSYHLMDGWLTACLPGEEGASPAWSIKAADIRLTMEGYAVLRHARFYVRDFPLLYTPYLILPAKKTRETGLLFPEYSQSKRDGTGLVTPYFINVSPSADLTLSPGYLAKRGPLVDGEWRYVLSPESRGWFNITYLNDTYADTIADDYQDDGWLRGQRQRYWLRGKADHVFTGGVTAKLDLDMVSDRDYLMEYRKGLTGYEQNNGRYVNAFHRGFQEEILPYRENTVQVSKDWNRFFAGIEMLAIRDVWETSLTGSHPQALPRLQFAGATSIDPLLSQLSWKTEYVNYWRDEGVGAHRLDIDPSLVTRLPLPPWFEGTVTLGLRETLYRIEPYGAQATWNHEQWQDRTNWSFRTDLATSLSRRYDFSWPGGTGVYHLLRPMLSYLYVPSPEQESLPSFDGTDLIMGENRFEYGFANFFSTRRTQSKGERNLGSLKILQSFDLREARRDTQAGASGQRAFSDLHADLDLYPREWLWLGYDTTMSAHGDGVTSYDFGANVSNQQGYGLSLAYRYKLNPDQQEPFFFQEPTTDSLHILSLDATALVTRTISMQGGVFHDFATHRTEGFNLQVNYQPGCWGVELHVSATPDDQRMSVVFSLAGFGRMVDVGLLQF